MMNIEDIRLFALALHPEVTEDLFAKDWLSFRIHGKWFLLVWLESPEPRIAINMQPDTARALRARYEGIQPAYHMNKQHWSDLFLMQLHDELVQQLIRQSYMNIIQKMPKKYRQRLALSV